MLWKTTMRAILAISVALLVVGCAGGSRTGSYSSESGWGNYRCKAIAANNPGRVSVGWASSKSQAQDNALDKCRAHLAGQGSCKILECVNDM